MTRGGGVYDQWGCVYTPWTHPRHYRQKAGGMHPTGILSCRHSILIGKVFSLVCVCEPSELGTFWNMDQILQYLGDVVSTKLKGSTYYEQKVIFHFTGL